MIWSVGKKIGLGFGLSLLALLIIGVTSYRNITQLEESSRLVNHTYEVIQTLDELMAALIDAETGSRGFAISGQSRYLKPYTVAIGQDGQEGLVGTKLNALQFLTQDNTHQQDRIRELRPLIALKIEQLETLITVRRQQGLPQVQQTLINRKRQYMDEIRVIAGAMENEEKTLLKSREQDVHASTRTTILSIVIGIPFFFVLLTFVGLLLARDIARPLGEMATASQLIAAGDLNVQVPGQGRSDEVGTLGQAFNTMIVSLRQTAQIAEDIAAGNLRVQVKPQSERDILGNALARMVVNLQGMLADIMRAATTLGSSASQIASSSIEMAAGAAQTSTAVVETTTTVSEIRQTAEMASHEASAVAQRAQEAAQTAQAGRAATESAGAGIEHIRNQMDSIASSMIRLSEQTQAIGDIIATVDDLTQQSNLLAVNAAIEAAKAGEQGKGFAVVAQEVKSLSEQSKQATTQVRTILSDIQKATTSAVMATEQGTKSVESGVVQSQQAGGSIRVLADGVAETAQSASQIAISSQEQLVGMEQVAQAMESIKQASAQNVESAKQLEVAARELTDLGARLQHQVERYHI